MSSIPLFSIAEGKPIPPDPAKRFTVTGISAHPKLAQVTSASRLEIRPMPEMVLSGVREIDALTGGLPRGCLTEICGNASSGRSSILLAALSAATQRQETCALVDVTDAFDPASAAIAGVVFEKFLWIRCGMRPSKNLPHTPAHIESSKKFRQMDRLDQALRVTDLLLQSGGFGMVIIDLADVPFLSARRIPLASWFRFQRAIEHTPTVLMLITQIPCAQTCATLLLQMKKQPSVLDGSFAKPSHTEILDELSIAGELLRSRLERKPVQSVTAAVRTKAIRIS